MIAYHSLQFAVFFFAVFVLYYAIPKKAQWWLLLAASVYFYWTASGALILWLLVSAGAVWIAGLGLERIASEGSAKIKAGKGVLTKEEKAQIKELFDKVSALNAILDKYDVEPSHSWQEYFNSVSRYFGAN